MTVITTALACAANALILFGGISLIAGGDKARVEALTRQITPSPIPSPVGGRA